MPHLLLNIGVDKMNKEIEDLKIRWREAMKRREQAIKEVNHYARLLNEARKKDGD